MYQFLRLTALLGLCLLLASCCTFCLIRSAPKEYSTFDREARPSSNASAMQGMSRAQTQAQPLDIRFADAQKEAVNKLRDSTPNEVKLLLYGYYSQAKQGDVKGERPGILGSKREREKYDAWERNRGMSRDEAVQRYIETVGRLE